MTMTRRLSLIVIAFLILTGCNNNKEYKTIGSIERLDPALDSIISSDAKVEIIAEGYDWSEGPLWVEQHNMLLFSDVPQNKVYKWTAEKGAEVYLNHSGYTGTVPRTGEMGSNGLILDKDGKLVLCQHGDRRLARMLAPLDSPRAEFETVAAKYDGKRFNSPNDAIFYGNAFYLTDPWYGLEQHFNDPTKETPFQGVYRVTAEGTVQLLIDSLTCPNGIAFFPGGKRFLVANSDPYKAKWYACDLSDPVQQGDDLVVNMTWKIFYDASSEVSPQVKGLPDGMKIDRNGNVFATGPGGVFIFNKEGKVLGKIKVPESTSNCAFSADEKTLYVTNDMNILRIKLRN